MIPFIYRRWYWRLAAGMLAGLLAWLLVEVMLNIQYRYFDLFNQPLNYLYAAIYGAILLEIIVRVNNRMERRFPWGISPGRRAFLQLLAGIFIVFIGVIVVRLLVNLFLIPGKLVIFSDEVVIMTVISSLVIFMNIAEFGLFLNERYRRSLGDLERFRKENAEYQFEMLKLQLNPHFLFNSLNTLSSLIYEDQEKAAGFIRKLSEVYRYVLDNRNRELVSLDQEMEFIRSFAFLLGLRFQGMIEFCFEVDEKLLEMKIAPMTLQLLIENAVKHNIASSQKPLRVKIITASDSISVTNNLQPRNEQNGTGVGLKNISSRYAFLTDKKVEIRNENGIFEVRIPLI